MKTYSIAFKNKNGDWITNWGQYFQLDEINWDKVKQYVKESNGLGYGYYYGHNSRNLTSKRCRTALEE